MENVIVSSDNPWHVYIFMIGSTVLWVTLLSCVIFDKLF